jgi:hypothetical protein
MSIRVVDQETGKVIPCNDMIDAGCAIHQISKERENASA